MPPVVTFSLWQKIGLFLGTIAIVGGGIWLWRMYRRRATGVVASVVQVDKNTGEVYINVNGKLKRAVMQPDTVKSFSAAGHATLVTTDVDTSEGKPRASRAMLYVYKPDDTIDTSQTKEIILI
jgi:hypothetical protein